MIWMEWSPPCRTGRWSVDPTTSKPWSSYRALSNYLVDCEAAEGPRIFKPNPALAEMSQLQGGQKQKKQAPSRSNERRGSAPPRIGR